MRLLEYVEEKRGIDIPKKEAMKLLSSKHSKAYKVHTIDYPIFRGVRGYGEYVYIDPSKSVEPRISRNTNNYYTLMIDNFSNWNKYPKRSKSIICTTDYQYASHMSSKVYRVFPENGSYIGVCPMDDIWGAIAYSPNNEWTYKDVGWSIHEIAKLPPIKADDPVDYSDMIDIFKKIERYRDKLDIYINDLYTYSNVTKDLWKEYRSSKKTFLYYMRQIIDPDLSGFKLVKTGNELKKFREVWISAPCVLVNVSVEGLSLSNLE